MHWSTNQTPFFANHDLHFKFNIQDANKIMKHVAKIRPCGWKAFEHNLCLTLKMCEGNIKKMLMNIMRKQLNFKVKN